MNTSEVFNENSQVKSNNTKSGKDKMNNNY